MTRRGLPQQRLVVATRSLGKLHELRPLLAGYGIETVDLDAIGIVERAEEEEALECFATFEENALAKARYFSARARQPTVADDSGLVVVALGGRPGVRTKRWSGRPDLSGRALDAANNAKLLAELDGVSERRARYVCVAAYVDDEGELVFRGESTGRILDAPRGSGGFGYDPLFLSDDLGVTFAQASLDAKAAVSHRGRAFSLLAAEVGGW